MLQPQPHFLSSVFGVQSNEPQSLDKGPKTPTLSGRRPKIVSNRSDVGASQAGKRNHKSARMLLHEVFLGQWEQKQRVH